LPRRRVYRKPRHLILYTTRKRELGFRDGDIKAPIKRPRINGWLNFLALIQKVRISTTILELQ
jgi:hypothetical protein